MEDGDTVQEVAEGGLKAAVDRGVTVDPGANSIPQRAPPIHPRSEHIETL